MAKWIPALRVTQKTAPFIFETVSLSSKDNINYQVQFDDLIWRFRTENNRPWTETSKMNHVNENGYVLESNLTFANVNKIVRYFLKGRTLRIKSFRSEGYYQVWPGLLRIPYIEKLRISQRRYLEGCLESFWNTKVGSLELRQYCNQNMTEQLSKIECDDVKLYSRYFFRFGVSYLSLPFKKLQLFESCLNIYRFCEFVEKFREGRHEVGCSYTGMYTVNDDWVLARLKARYSLKIEDENFLMIATDNPDRDLLVERRKDPPFGSYKHSVKVVDRYSEELKRITSIHPTRAIERYPSRPDELCSLLIIFFFSTLALLFSYVLGKPPHRFHII